MTTTANSSNAKSDQTRVLEPKDNHILKSSIITILISMLSMVAGALGYRTYTTMVSNPSSGQNIENLTPSGTPNPVVFQPSPSPIPLHAGIGDYAVSHAKTGGPTIQRVIFDPLDAQKGKILKLAAEIRSDSPAMEVTGGLTTDTQQIELTFTKSGTTKNGQIWSTEILLPDTVLYTYIFTITATDSMGKSTVRVSPRS